MKKHRWEKDDYELRRSVKMPDHPNVNKNGSVVLYRLKAEKQIGRYLKPGEVVHHHYNTEGTYDLVVCKNIGIHRRLDIISNINLEVWARNKSETLENKD